MKNALLLYTSLLGMLFLSACGNTLRYASHDIQSKTQMHRQVAIVPAVITYTGPMPRDITEEEKMGFDIAESRLYQESLYHFLLRKSHTHVRVDIQPIERTHAILRDAKINTHASWRMDPQKLAELLGVDAVIRLQVDENRYMSDLTGLGIDAGRAVLRGIFYGPPAYPYPYPVTPTAEIRSSCSIFDAQGGQLIWKMGVIRHTNWSQPPEVVIDHINRKVARNFPYKG